MLCQPLHHNLQKGKKFEWTSEDDSTLTSIKTAVSTEIGLTHFDPNKPLIITTDASAVGIGAVLTHKESNGNPIMVACRVLSKAEQNYSTTDRESLAIIYAIRKFHQYLAGTHFTILCDHKPLRTIFGEKTALPKLAASCLTRWAIELSGYDYNIEYKPGRENQLADALSRLPARVDDTATEYRIPVSYTHLTLPTIYSV